MSDRQQKPILYSYWRSSCSWRVRIALAIKGVDYEYRVVDLLSAESLNNEEFVKANPAQKVPAFVVNGQAITESLAIIEYLDEVYPDKPILPKDPIKRAQSRAIALQIVSGIQPLQNLRALKKLNAKEAGYGREWCAFWINDGLVALEKMIAKTVGKYTVGDEITIADLTIPSMVYNAARFGVDTSKFPFLMRVDKALAEIPEFIAALPDNQPDAGLNA